MNAEQQDGRFQVWKMDGGLWNAPGMRGDYFGEPECVRFDERDEAEAHARFEFNQDLSTRVVVDSANPARGEVILARMETIVGNIDITGEQADWVLDQIRSAGRLGYDTFRYNEELGERPATMRSMVEQVGAPPDGLFPDKHAWGIIKPWMIGRMVEHFMHSREYRFEPPHADDPVIGGKTINDKGEIVCFHGDRKKSPKGVDSI